MGGGSLWRFLGEGWIRSGLELFLFYLACKLEDETVGSVPVNLPLTCFVCEDEKISWNEPFCAKLARERDVIDFAAFPR
jgi:hypothetical protein